MQVELQERTEENVRIYFERTRDPEIQARIPQRSQTVEQALEDYRRSLAPGADSYGRTVWADGVYVGDVWCYCIHAEADPDAMVSYCIFDKDRWRQGIASRALEQFLGLLPMPTTPPRCGCWKRTASLSRKRLRRRDAGPSTLCGK